MTNSDSRNTSVEKQRIGKHAATKSSGSVAADNQKNDSASVKSDRTAIRNTPQTMQGVQPIVVNQRFKRPDSAASTRYDHQTKTADHAQRHESNVYAAQHETTEEAPKRHAGKIAALTILGALAIVYIAGFITFSLITYPNTSIAGVDCSLMTKNAAASHVDSAWQRYQLNVTGDGFSWNYKPEGNESIVNSSNAVTQCISNQKAFIWPVGLISNLNGRNESIGVSENIDLDHDADTSLLSDAFNKNEFEQQLGSAVDQFNQNRDSSFTAQAAYDEKQGKFTVEKAKSNQQLNKDNVIKYVEIELGKLSTQADLTKLGDKAYNALSGATDQQLQAACDAANQMLGTNVTFKLDGNDAGKLDSSTFKEWITFDDKLTPSLDSAKVSEWANKLADSFNTVGSKRDYKRADGKQISVEGGDYGWSVDTAAVVSAVEDAVNNKKSGEINLTYKTKGDTYTKKGEKDWKSYIDVDLAEQHARYYDDNGNIVWESGFISGNITKGNGTPTGVYYIKSNNGSSTLLGKPDPATGEPEYKTKVNYWMPFEGNAVGFHDANWQRTENFGNPEAFKSVGSHGCINLPPNKAQELSGKIHVGLCVVVHN